MFRHQIFIVGTCNTNIFALKNLVDISNVAKLIIMKQVQFISSQLNADSIQFKTVNAQFNSVLSIKTIALIFQILFFLSSSLFSLSPSTKAFRTLRRWHPWCTLSSECDVSIVMGIPPPHCFRGGIGRPPLPCHRDKALPRLPRERENREVCGIWIYGRREEYKGFPVVRNMMVVSSTTGVGQHEKCDGLHNTAMC